MKITKKRLSEIIREEVNNFKLEEGGFGGHAERAVILTLPDAVQQIEDEAERVARFLGHGEGSEVVRGEEQFLVKALENLYKIAAQLKHHPAYEDSPMTEEDTLKLPKPEEDPLGRDDSEDPKSKTSKLRRDASARWRARNFPPRKK
jgi:hypothetical protein|tara:strand:- start:23 stop:463 length:441 start_codon:yes stop_codon:yes gene_type:complete